MACFIGYIRAGNGAPTPEDQESAIRSLARQKRYGASNVEIRRDECGFSAPLADRQAGATLFQLASGDRVIGHIQGLFASTEDAADSLERWDERGILLDMVTWNRFPAISTSARLSGAYAARVLRGFLEAEKSWHSEATREGIARKRSGGGRWTNRAPIGIDWCDGEVTFDWREMVLCRWLSEMNARGVSATRLWAALLHKELGLRRFDNGSEFSRTALDRRIQRWREEGDEFWERRLSHVPPEESDVVKELESKLEILEEKLVENLTDAG